MTFPVVYFYDHSRENRSLDDISALLGEERYNYCKKMKNVKAGLCSAYAFLLLRYALNKEFGITAVPSFIRGEQDKPFLRDTPDIFFNLSHSGTSEVCAVSRSPVGVDIQDIRPLTMRVGKKFLTEKEYEKVAHITDPDELSKELCRIWCIKESYGKFTGKGFVEGFCNFGADDLVNDGKVRFTFRNNAFISVCRES